MSNPFMAITQARLHKLAEDKRKREERKARNRRNLGMGIGLVAGAVTGGLGYAAAAGGAAAAGFSTAGAVAGASAGMQLGGAVAGGEPAEIAQAGVSAAGAYTQYRGAAAGAASINAELGTNYTAGDMLDMGPGGGTQMANAVLSMTAASAQAKEAQARTENLVFLNGVRRGLSGGQEQDSGSLQLVYDGVSARAAEVTPSLTLAGTSAPRRTQTRGATAPRRLSEGNTTTTLDLHNPILQEIPGLKLRY